MGRKYMAAWIAASLDFVYVRHQTGLCAYFSKITLPPAILNLSSYLHLYIFYIAVLTVLLYTYFVTFHFLTFLCSSSLRLMSFLLAVIHTSSSSFQNLSPHISSHPLLSVSSLPVNADSLFSTQLSTSHSFILFTSDKPPNTSLAHSRWKGERQEFCSHPVISFRYSADGQPTVLPPEQVQQMNLRSTGMLNNVQRLFSHHMIQTFGCDYSTSGVTLAALQTKLRNFLDLCTEDGPRHDTYLIFYSGHTHKGTGAWALAGKRPMNFCFNVLEMSACSSRHSNSFIIAKSNRSIFYLSNNTQFEFTH